VTVTRVILAFLLSPLAYIFVYLVAVMLVASFVEESYGVLFSASAYFLYVLVSIPVFLLVHRVYRWNFLSCWGSALLVVILPEVMTIVSKVPEAVPRYQLWLLSVLAALVYGGVFWLLAPPDFRGKVVT